MNKDSQIPLWYLLVPLVALLFAMHFLSERQGEQISYSEFKRLVAEEKVEDPVLLPEGLPASREYAEETARAIDQEVRGLLEEACERARTILQKKQETLHRLAKILLDREVIEGPELQEILG